MACDSYGSILKSVSRELVEPWKATTQPLRPRSLFPRVIWLNILRLLVFAPYGRAMFFPQKLGDFPFLQGKVSPPNHLGEGKKSDPPQF